MRSVGWLLGLILGVSQSAFAASSGGSHGPPPTRIDPAVAMAFEHVQRHGVVPSWFDARRPARRPAHMLPVLVRLKGASPPRLERLLSQWGLSARDVIALREGRPLSSGALPLWINARAAQVLSQRPEVSSLRLDLPRRRLMPLAASRERTRMAEVVRAQLSARGELLDGKGVLIADIDGGVFPHHPTLFHADGGAFAWQDVDGDGRFTVGVDTVDLGDGAQPLQLFRAEASMVDGSAPPAAEWSRAAGPRPQLDYLYVDANGNGARDYGAGFGEDTPAYGEPLFLIDDANQNGVLEPGERLLRLKTSKYRAIYTDVERKRGDARAGVGAWVPGEELAGGVSHGLAVSGILVGGHWERSALRGLLPGAELVLYDYYTQVSESQTAAVQWAIDQGADVILTEYGVYGGMAMDGSSEEELLLDAAGRDAVVVNPAGNLYGGGKHTQITVSEVPQQVAVQTDAYFEGSPGLILTALERGTDTEMQWTLHSPLGAPFTLPREDMAQPVAWPGAPGVSVWASRERTSRGTTMRVIYIYTQGASLPLGDYALEVASTAPASVPLELFVTDYTTGWAYGATFAQPVDERTLCHPATADNALAVAASVLHGGEAWGAWGEPNEMAGYSSAGPRYDGTPGIHLTAPDNPLAPTVPFGTQASFWFAPFGGTSGAGPHVAAVAGMLRQALPSESAPALRERLLRSAEPVNGPAERWGRGRLDAAAALGVAMASSDPPSGLRVVLPSAPLRVGEAVELEVQMDSEARGARVLWDFDYDGVADTGWEPRTTASFVPRVAGVQPVRVTVANAHGVVMGAVQSVRVLAPGEPAEPTPPQASLDPLETLGGGGGCSASSSQPAPAGAFVGLAWVWAARLGMRRRRGVRP